MGNEQEIEKLFNIWFAAKHKLLEFEITFSNDKEIKQLREEFLSNFFYNLNELYWNYFLITIAKLLDPYKQGQNRNLTLFILPEILKKNKISEWEKVYENVSSLKKEYDSIIKYRRKKIAHFDFNYSIGKEKFDTSTHVDEVNNFFNEMFELINLTLKALDLPEKYVTFMMPIPFKGASRLNQILKKHKKYTQQKDN